MTDTWVGMSPVGVVRVRGEDRVDLLQRLSTNDVARLAHPGAAFTTVFTSEKGRVVDWVVVLARDEELVLRTSPGRGAGVLEWIDRFTIMEDVRGTDESAAYALVVAHGPAAPEVLGVSVGEGALAAAGEMLVARGLAAHGPRLEALVPVAAAPGIVERAVARGARPGDAALFERLRLLAGVPSPEHEFRDEVSPLELRLGPAAVSFTKGCYVGQEVIARIDSYDKLARVLVGFEADAAVPAGDLKLARGGRVLGRVTSALSTGGGALGLGIVRRDEAAPGPVEVVGASGAVAGRLVDRPFWA